MTRRAFLHDLMRLGGAAAGLGLLAYDLIVNMRTARSLGLSFPPAFLAQVDEVIE